MHEYKIVVAGTSMTMQLDDAHAAALGLKKPAANQIAAPANKAVTPANRAAATPKKATAAAPKRTRGPARGKPSAASIK